MNFDLQPALQNGVIILQPLVETDFEQLYAVAADPLVWAQHPNKNRYQKEVFAVFFEGALASGGAFLVLDATSGEVIGSTRFYDVNLKQNHVTIGYTFYARRCWGGAYNRAAKALMLAHAFKYVNTVLFFIGANNIRSQKAIERIGATKIREAAITYYGETETTNFVYAIRNFRLCKVENETDLGHVDALYQAAFGSSAVPFAVQKSWWQTQKTGAVALYHSADIEKQTLAAAISYWYIAAAMYALLIAGKIREKELIVTTNTTDNQDFIYISDIAVLPEMQGKKYGFELLEYALTAIKNRTKNKKASVCALAFSEGGAALLVRFGFVLSANLTADGMPLYILDIELF